jgi:hypothetical protein
MSDAAEQSQVRVLFALRTLAPEVQSEVLSDGTIQSEFQLQATRPVNLTDRAVVAQQDLFAAFARAATRTPATVSIRHDGTQLDCKVWIEPDAAAVLEIPGQRLRFSYAALLVEERERRLEFIETILAAHTLTLQSVAELRRVAGLDPFTHDDFLAAVQRLDSSPEAFARGLAECLRKKQGVRESDLLPEDVRYWDNLTATHAGSPTLAEFIGAELGAERRARIEADAARGFRSMALTFGAPELVPMAWLRELDVETVLRGVGEIVSMDDHFSLVGAFEICADWVAKDTRFVTLGDQLLDRLFANTESLMQRCQTFAAAFVLAMSRLSLHASTREQPGYWRRLAAVAHAGLIVRACRSSSLEREGLLRWALEQRQLEYRLCVYMDMTDQPQWRPEWLDPGFLAADAFGRINSAVLMLPVGIAPAGWEDRLASAKQWIEQRRWLLRSQYAAIMQGSRRKEHPTPDAKLQQHIDEDYRRLEEQPSAENLLVLTPWVETLVLPPAISDGVHKALEVIRKDAERADAEVIQAALSLAAHVAVLSADVPLADAVAETYLQRLRTMKGQLPVADAVLRLVECAAADPDRVRARDVLAKRLERLSFALPTGTPAQELIAALEVMQRLDGELAPLIGRAMHAARLAASAMKAS